VIWPAPSGQRRSAPWLPGERWPAERGRGGRHWGAGQRATGSHHWGAGQQPAGRPETCRGRSRGVHSGGDEPARGGAQSRGGEWRRATHLAADDGAEQRDSRRDSRRQACEAARLRPDASERCPIPWLGLDFLVGLMSDGPKNLKN